LCTLLIPFNQFVFSVSFYMLNKFCVLILMFNFVSVQSLHLSSLTLHWILVPSHDFLCAFMFVFCILLMFLYFYLVPITTNILSSNPTQAGVLDATLCDKVYQWLAAGLWFSPGTLVSPTNKIGRLAEILLKVVLNTLTLLLNKVVFFCILTYTTLTSLCNSYEDFCLKYSVNLVIDLTVLVQEYQNWIQFHFYPSSAFQNKSMV